MGKIINFQEGMKKREKDISSAELQGIQTEIEEYYRGWLECSKMTEEELMKYRIVNKFKIEKIQQDSYTGCRMMYEDEEKKMQRIGEVILIPPNNKEAMLNMCYLLLYIAAKWDKLNKDNPVNGSYASDYFGTRAKAYAKKVLFR